MVLPYTLSPDFNQHVDNLLHDASLSDRALHARAQRYLQVFSEANTVHVNRLPTWAERILQKYPGCDPPFTTPGLFDAMYAVAEELGLLVGTRYVSAAICVCAERVARAGEAADPQAADLAQALHELSSTWAAFLIWPFYAHGEKHRERERYHSQAPEDETPTEESMAREHRRRWKQQVMARDDYHCFMSGALDYRAYRAGRRVPAGGRVMHCYTVPIISPEVWAPTEEPADDRDSEAQLDQHIPSQDITLGILMRFCGLDAATLVEKARDGPHNALFVHVAAGDAFRQLMWCLHPTETPDRYAIRNHMEPVYSACHHVSTHVAFPNNDASGADVDPPDRALLRAHAALAGVLHRSGAYDAFLCLRLAFLEGRLEVYLGTTGGAFWTRVVEYEGPEVCAGVERWRDVERE